MNIRLKHLTQEKMERSLYTWCVFYIIFANFPHSTFGIFFKMSRQEELYASKSSEIPPKHLFEAFHLLYEQATKGDDWFALWLKPHVRKRFQPNGPCAGRSFSIHFPLSP